MSTFKTENDTWCFVLIWFLLEAKSTILGSGVLLSSDPVQNQIQTPRKLLETTHMELVLISSGHGMCWRDSVCAFCSVHERGIWCIWDRLQLWCTNRSPARPVSIEPITSEMVWNWQVELPHKQVTGDRAKVKPCQLVRNLPGGGLAGFAL